MDDCDLQEQNGRIKMVIIKSHLAYSVDDRNNRVGRGSGGAGLGRGASFLVGFESVDLVRCHRTLLILESFPRIDNNSESTFFFQIRSSTKRFLNHRSAAAVPLTSLESFTFNRRRRVTQQHHHENKERSKKITGQQRIEKVFTTTPTATPTSQRRCVCASEVNCGLSNGCRAIVFSDIQSSTAFRKQNFSD
ncbi:hypothetical protein Tsp_09597 [Trichinella spiralis]|uniref:hypothetical protein n=1 Tax=Trichinella spiralis TaxID=6334 RepID=UPI0001EFEE4B|nr:hypothetical protein Tsp_09597 [Trichinella spiralis]